MPNELKLKYISANNYTDLIGEELVRNGNRYVLDVLNNNGISNVNGININISREEFIKRLKGSNVDENILRKVLRREDLNE